jgi:DnaJ-related protein SCJ1
MRLTSVLLVALLTLLQIAFAQEDFYDILGLPQKEDSSEKDIKKQFRTLSRKWHPDHNNGEDARALYQKIQRAHDVLSDRRKRKVYDMKGEEGLKQLEESERNPNAGMHDPFAALFGGGQQRNQHKGQDVQMNLQVSLSDLYNGGTHQLTLTKQKLCRRCKGTGAESKSDMKKCTHCEGRGHVVQRVQIMPGFVQQMQQPCPHCGGKGKVVKKKCPACSGKKVTRGEYTLEVELEQGMPEGHRLVFDMEADQSPDLIPGDVIFVVQTKPDAVFTRKGNDLEATMKISLREALLGFTKTLTHMDGRAVTVSQDGVTQYNKRVKIAGEGMPIHHVPSEKGDLYVTLQFEMPRELSDSQRTQLGSIFGKPGSN